MLKKMNEQEKRQANGGSVAALIIAGMAIAGPFADGAWNLGQKLGQMIVNRRK